jgi:hypothetical protein
MKHQDKGGLEIAHEIERNSGERDRIAETAIQEFDTGPVKRVRAMLTGTTGEGSPSELGFRTDEERQKAEDVAEFSSSDEFIKAHVQYNTSAGIRDTYEKMREAISEIEAETVFIGGVEHCGVPLWDVVVEMDEEAGKEIIEEFDNLYEYGNIGTTKATKLPDVNDEIYEEIRDGDGEPSDYNINNPTMFVSREWLDGEHKSDNKYLL